MQRFSTRTDMAITWAAVPRSFAVTSPMPYFRFARLNLRSTSTRSHSSRYGSRFRASELMYLMNGYWVFKVHGGACDPLTPLLQHSRLKSELIILKKIFMAKPRCKKTGCQADTLLQKSLYSITACTAAVPFPASAASPLKNRGCAPFSTVTSFYKTAFVVLK